MSNRVIYENNGALDMRAFTLMGVNAKPNTTSAIGYFGTGLKYAMAVLAREDQTVYVQDGMGNEWQMQQVLTKFRDKDFVSLVLTPTAGGPNIELPFTTELGKRWQTWMAMRELECNMRDENGEMVVDGPHRAPEQGKVRIIVEGDKYFACVVNQRKEVFFDVAHTVIGRGGGIEYAEGQSNRVYYRGILVLQLPADQKLTVTYNILDAMVLTEDRTLSGTYSFGYLLRDLMVEEGNTSWREKLLGALEAQEYRLMNITTSPTFYHPSVLQQIEDRYLRGQRLHPDLTKMMARHLTEKEMEKEYEALDDEQEMIDTAIERLLIVNYTIRDFPVRIVNALPDDALGQADRIKNLILIARKNFELGIETVMATLLEEWLHLKFNYDDNSRELQDYLLRQNILNLQRFINLMNRKEGNGKRASRRKSVRRAN